MSDKLVAATVTIGNNPLLSDRVAGVGLAPLRFDRCFVRKASYTAEASMLKKALLFGVVALASVGTALAQGKAQLIIESWRNDDLKVWRNTIIPAFTKKHPDIAPNFEIVVAPALND